MLRELVLLASTPSGVLGALASTPFRTIHLLYVSQGASGVGPGKKLFLGHVVPQQVHAPHCQAGLESLLAAHRLCGEDGVSPENGVSQGY